MRSSVLLGAPTASASPAAGPFPSRGSKRSPRRAIAWPAPASAMSAAEGRTPGRAWGQSRRARGSASAGRQARSPPKPRTEHCARRQRGSHHRVGTDRGHRGTLIYLCLFLLLRLVLKRQAAGVAITDLLVIVLIADAAHNAMADIYRSVSDGVFLVAVIVFR